MRATTLTLCGLLCAAPALAQDAAQPKEKKPAKAKVEKKELTATAQLQDAEGKQVGEAKLRQTPNGVIVDLKLTGIPEGSHAFHIHQTGKCEAPFKSAGGHFNPKKKQHGIENKKGMHAGDFPNLEVPKSGDLQISLFTDKVTLKKGPTSVFDKDGSAFIIHAGADDYHSDPAGNAGDRLACGIIQPQQK